MSSTSNIRQKLLDYSIKIFNIGGTEVSLKEGTT